MPAVIGPAPGGLGYWQVLELLHAVFERARIGLFNLVELMPSRDRDGAGALVAGRIAAVAMGLIARQIAEA
jgi:agmatinase